MTKLERLLTENSIQAFLLALEIINKVTVLYRVQAFTFLFCNAWELLLKARLTHVGQNIFYKTKPREPPRSLSLTDCLNRLFASGTDPSRLNIERVQELRDGATHLVIPVIPASVMGLFQAGVLNYARLLRDWTGQEITNRISVGMMALVCDLDPTLHSLDSPLLRRQMTAETIRWLKQFQERVRATASELGHPETFSIAVEVKLAIVKNPSRADIVLSSAGSGTDAVVMEIAKDPDRTHPYRQKEVIGELNKRCLAGAPFNQHHVLSVRRVHNIDRRPEYYYKGKYTSPQYSEAFVDWMVSEFERSPDFFERARERYKART